MGMFDGINDAEIFERGKFLSGKCSACEGLGHILPAATKCPACEGLGHYKGVLKVRKVLAKETLKSGVGFIVEFEVVESNMCSEHPVGSKVTWFQKMSDKTVAFPAIKEWAAAVAGYETNQKDAIDQEVSPYLQQALTEATNNPHENSFTGIPVRVEATQILTKNDREFTRHTWGPYTDPETGETGVNLAPQA